MQGMWFDPWSWNWDPTCYKATKPVLASKRSLHAATRAHRRQWRPSPTTAIATEPNAGTVWCPGSPQSCLEYVCSKAELGYGSHQTVSRLKQMDSPWSAPLQVSPLSQELCTSGEVFFTPFTGRLSNLPRVTQPQGAKLKSECSLFGLKTWILSVA